MTLDDDVARLARTRPFSLMPREALQLLAFSSEKKRLKAGELAFGPSEKADAGYFVLSGALTIESADGGSAKTRVVEAGALIGENALVAEVARPFAARAAVPSVVLRAPRDVFRRVLIEFPAAAAKIRRAYSARTRRIVAELDASRIRALDAVGSANRENRRAL